VLLLEEFKHRKRKARVDGSKETKPREEAKPQAHPDERPGAIGSLFGDGEET
jgi:hypothetical protein